MGMDTAPVWKTMHLLSQGEEVSPGDCPQSSISHRNMQVVAIPLPCLQALLAVWLNLNRPTCAAWLTNHSVHLMGPAYPYHDDRRDRFECMFIKPIGVFTTAPHSLPPAREHSCWACAAKAA